MGFWDGLNSFIHAFNDAAVEAGKQNIAEIRKQNELYAQQEITRINSMQYLTNQQKEYFVSQVISELQRKQQFQNQREAQLDLTKIFNEASKACDKNKGV